MKASFLGQPKQLYSKFLCLWQELATEKSFMRKKRKFVEFFMTKPRFQFLPSLKIKSCERPLGLIELLE